MEFIHWVAPCFEKCHPVIIFLLHGSCISFGCAFHAVSKEEFKYSTNNNCMFETLKTYIRDLWLIFVSVELALAKGRNHRGGKGIWKHFEKTLFSQKWLVSWKGTGVVPKFVSDYLDEAFTYTGIYWKNNS